MFYPTIKISENDKQSINKNLCINYTYVTQQTIKNLSYKINFCAIIVFIEICY